MILDATNEVTNPEGNRAQDASRVIGHAIHHTVTDVNGPAVPDEHATEAQERAHIRAIDLYHVKLGYGGFGYYGIAYASGRAYWCGDGQRAHVARRNHELRGFALAGTFTSSLPGIPQMDALRELLRADGARVIKGHSEWALPGDGTACPGIVVPRDWEAFMNEGAPVFEDGWRKEGKFQILRNEGVDVFRIGGDLPGRISKNFGGTWWWLTAGDSIKSGEAHASWSIEEGD